MPILWIFCLLMPGASMGSTIRLLLRWAGPSSVLASRQHQSAFRPLVIHILVPLMTQSPPSARAVVLMAATSEPPPGSLTPRQATMSPRRVGAK